MQKKVETVKPYAGPERKSEQIEDAFNRLAPRYDFMNRLLSLGIDTLWRRRAIESAAAHTPVTIIDLATGTGDMAVMEARRFAGARITGVDLSPAMLAMAEKKCARLRLQGRIQFMRADCLALPFDDNSFDMATIAFGIRNFESLSGGCREILRVLQPGGRVVILELSRPQTRLLSALYRCYLSGAVPALGKLFTGHPFEYAYLQKSIDCVPQGDAMLAILREAGFTECRAERYTLGICSCYTAGKHALP